MIYLRAEGSELVATTMDIPYGDQETFLAHNNALKAAKFKFCPKDKTWRMPIVMVPDNLYDVLMLFVKKVWYDDATRQYVKAFPSMLPSELKREPLIEKIDYEEIVNGKPFPGKHPYEMYQDTDIRRALSQNRFLFNWEMGLGKSFATAVCWRWSAKNRNCEKMFLFTSKVGTYNLKDEMVKFCKGLKEEETLVLASDDDLKLLKQYLPRGKKLAGYRKIFDIPEVCNKRLIVFNYDAWKLIAKAYGDTATKHATNVPIKNFFNDYVPFVCFDECHKLANPKSERTKLIFKYLRYYPYRYTFSATPADKNEKIYSAAMILDPKLVFYLHYNDWINKYNDVGTYFSKYAINKKKWHENELSELNYSLLDYSAKRMAVDCLNLPELKVPQPIMLDLDPEQANIYKTAVNYLINKAIQEGKDGYGLADVVRDCFLLIQTLLENPNVCGLDSSSTKFSPEIKEMCEKYDYANNFAKLKVVDDIIEDEAEEERRGLLWYTHPKTMACLKERYKDYNPIIVNREATDAERDALIAEFKKNPEHKILIASINIMNTSVTVTEATYAIYLENTYSYENYFQSTGRIYRIGQKTPVKLYHMYYKNTANIYNQIALDNKKDLVKMLFSGEKLSLGLAQIKELFIPE